MVEKFIFTTPQRSANQLKAFKIRSLFLLNKLNDKQSALESRLTQQYGLQNDFNNDQVHFNNQARQFFTENAYVAPPPSAPPMFVGSGVYQQPVLNPFQKTADDASSIQSNQFSNDEFNFDNT